MMKKSIIKLEDVWKIYQMGDTEVKALQGINIIINKGEFVCIVGPSGSGKSTAVNMVGCLDTPTRGRILLDNKDISKLSESELAQIRGRKIGFIFQTFNLISTLTALENVMMPMVFQGLLAEERKKKARELLKLVELEDRMHHRPGELSGGQRQRVAIARALANDPEVILADEPTGNLDSKTGNSIVDMLARFHKKEKRTIIMVTHDMDLTKYAERVFYLRDGKIIREQRRRSKK